MDFKESCNFYVYKVFFENKGKIQVSRKYM